MDSHVLVWFFELGIWTPMVPTNKNLGVPKKTRFVPKKNTTADIRLPPKMYEKPPVCTKKKPLFDVAGIDPHKSNVHKKTPFPPKKTSCLAHVCYTCGPLCTKTPTWLPLFILK